MIVKFSLYVANKQLELCAMRLLHFKLCLIVIFATIPWIMFPKRAYKKCAHYTQPVKPVGNVPNNCNFKQLFGCFLAS